MTPFKIFYSWQADRPGALCRHFIHKALQAAAGQLGGACDLEVVIGSDTQGEPGTPPITDTIPRKIRECDAFLGDMTFVGETSAGKLLTNPNVMGEYGYALAQKSTRRIMLVMNTAFGPPEKLPFDLHHLRHPLTFNAPEGIADSARRSARSLLAQRLQDPLRLLVKEAQAEAAPTPAATGEVARRAREAVVSLVNAIEQAPKPAIVSKPKIVLHLAPFAALSDATLDVRTAARVMADVKPIHLSKRDTGVDEREWWVRGTGQVIPGRPNPETSWYVRLVRPGIFEVALNLGFKIDDDPRAWIDGYQVEAAIVDMLDQCAAAALALKLGGPAFVSAALVIAEDVDVTMGRIHGRLSKPFVAFDMIEIPALTLRTGDYMGPLFDQLWTAAGISTGSNSIDQEGWAGYTGERAFRL